MMKQDITWKQAAEAWKKGEPVWTAELGGIGPGYEQAIQILLFELMLRWGDKPLPEPVGDKYPSEWDKHVNEVVHALDQDCNGFSGAQVGVASGTAYQFMRIGYAEMMNKLEDDRKILVSKGWPKAPPAVAA